jgi:hypothetical protein
MALIQLKGLARPAMAIGRSHLTARTAIGTNGLSIERVSTLAPVAVVNERAKMIVVRGQSGSRRCREHFGSF